MPVTFVPDAIVAHAVAVVACEDYDGIFGEVELIQMFQDAPHVAVYAFYTAEIIARHAFYTFDIEVGEIRVGDFRVEIFKRLPVAVRLRQPRGVRGAVVEAEQKGAVFV